MMKHGLLAGLMQSGHASRQVATLLLAEMPMELSDTAFQEAVELVIGAWQSEWLTEYPELFIDPKTREGEPMGLHQTTAPLLPYRSCFLNGAKVFMFERHIHDLISAD
jgi:hypothetical protein